MKMDGRSGAARIVIGSCRSLFHDSRSNSRGVNALSVVMDALETEDVSKRVALRLLGDNVDGIVGSTSKLDRRKDAL